MELPIQLKFFKKLELYQELKIQDNKKKKTRLNDWILEKDILYWTAEGHHHLGSNLNNEDIKQILNGYKKYQGNKLPGYKFAKENLVARGFAKGLNGDDTTQGIKTTLEGLLMGQVIKDVQDGGINRLKYPLFIKLTWLTIVAGVYLVIKPFIMDAIPLLIDYCQLIGKIIINSL